MATRPCLFHPQRAGTSRGPAVFGPRPVPGRSSRDCTRALDFSGRVPAFHPQRAGTSRGPSVAAVTMARESVANFGHAFFASHPLRVGTSHGPAVFGPRPVPGRSSRDCTRALRILATFSLLPTRCAPGRHAVRRCSDRDRSPVAAAATARGRCEFHHAPLHPRTRRAPGRRAVHLTDAAHPVHRGTAHCSTANLWGHEPAAPSPDCSRCSFGRAIRGRCPA